jgi:membrane associated rhomboid family serine protease
MIADRPYMRREPDGFRWSLTIVLIVINVLVFFLEYADGARSKAMFEHYGALSLKGLKEGFVWQFLTFQFLHGDHVHLILNCLVLFSFGRHVEAFLGKRAYLQLYLWSGFAGGILQVLIGLLWPRFGGTMVGASAGVCGVIAAFAYLSPHSTIYLFFVVPIRAKFFVHLTIALCIILPFALPALGVRDNIAHAAHLGGTLFGVAYLRWLREWDGFASFWHRLKPRRRARPIVKVRFPKTTSNAWESETGSTQSVTDGDFISKEVDPILDKIRAHGIHSLTQQERDILEKARERMDRR